MVVFSHGNKDGNVIWSYVGDQWYFSAPACSNQVIYFGSGDDGTLTALRVADGGPVWKAECPDIAISRPCIIDDLVVIGCSDGSVVAFEARSGKVKWTYEPEWGDGNIEEVLESEGKIVVY